LTFFVFHFEISGNEVNEEQHENILFIKVTFSVFHFEISGSEVNEEQLKKV
jgi:hypothetical protein